MYSLLGEESADSDKILLRSCSGIVVSKACLNDMLWVGSWLRMILRA